MHVQTRIGTNEAIIAEASPAMEESQLIDIVLASDAHGAFIWGVFDRLLDEPDLAIGSITSSGFGAMEAAVLAYGLALGGRRGARTALTNFWRRVSHASMFKADTANPLKPILEQSIDIEEIRKKNCPVKLNILVSNARNDTVKMFPSDQLSIEAVLAAATIPFRFPAVEIDGEIYWGDGDISVLPRCQSIEAGLRLIITGKPAGFITPCANRCLTANPVTPKPTLHTIFDSEYRAGAALFTRPWTDWGELTEMRDRGHGRADDWLVVNHPFVDERSAVDSKNRYV
ncbi:patatin-like phospholipase family protein [Mesorhizobium calcicola]|uniref:Patatin-like phospholipase family protein n=1 Tax=Mesorhizobium calcicola TaxID=1300310 RepID=A0ABW4WSD6_9HYPH